MRRYNNLTARLNLDRRKANFAARFDLDRVVTKPTKA